MGFADQKFYSRPLVERSPSGVATGTATASGTNTLATAFPFIAYKRRTKINAIRVATVTVAKSGTSVQNMIFLNGTNTVGTLGTGTATAGAYIDAVMTPNIVTTSTVTNSFANGSTAVATITTTTTQSVFAINGAPTVTVITTSTASADTVGTYRIFFEEQEAFDVGAGS